MAVNPIGQTGGVLRQYNEAAAAQRLGKAGAGGVHEAQQQAQAAPGPRQTEDAAAADRNRQRRPEQAPKPRTVGGRVDTYA